MTDHARRTRGGVDGHSPFPLWLSFDGVRKSQQEIEPEAPGESPSLIRTARGCQLRERKGVLEMAVLNRLIASSSLDLPFAAAGIVSLQLKRLPIPILERPEGPTPGSLRSAGSGRVNRVCTSQRVHWTRLPQADTAAIGPTSPMPTLARMPASAQET